MTTLGEGYDDLPVVPGEVVGWRAWVVVEWGVSARLRSLYQDVIWPTDDWLVAEALEGDREPHGVCAARDREHLASMHRYMWPSEPRYVSGGGVASYAAIGEVGLAGVIIPGERGFRAEKARPLSILVPYAAWELVEPLRRAYNVRVSLSNVMVPKGRRGNRS